MHTFKTTLKVLLAQKLMILIYVVWLCLMMFGLSWTLITNLSASDSSVHYESAKADVAVVNRDAHGADLVDAMREFLAKDCNLVDVGTTSEDLQTAAASNYADLIVIVPDGYTQHLADALTNNGDEPELDVVVSFTGAYGSLAKLQVDDFLRLTRIEALAQQTQTGAAVTPAALNTAAICTGIFAFGTTQAVAWCICISFAINFIQCYHALFCLTLRTGWGAFWRSLLSSLLLSALVCLPLAAVGWLLPPMPMLVSLAAKGAAALAVWLLYIQFSGEYDLKGTALRLLSRKNR